MKPSKYYAKNLSTIKEVYPHLAAWLEAEADVPWITIDPAANGVDNLYVSTGSRVFPAYDKENPIATAKTVAGHTSLKKEDVTVLVGAGLGYAARHILKKMERGHQLVLVEPVAQLVRHMLSGRDYSRDIRRRNLIIAGTKQDAGLIVSLLEEQRFVDEWYPVMEMYTKTRPEYLPITEYLLETLNQVRCNTGTVIGSGGKIADNDIANLPYVIRHRGVRELVDLFKGKPAVLVSTGPSLARNIHMLRDIQDKAVIIAVGQALRPLLAYDIKPDFICTVDFGAVNMGHFRGLLDSDVPLVALNRTYAPLLRAYKGPKFISAWVDEAYNDTAHGILKDAGALSQGGSVAHMCFGLGWALGCDPLIMVGQDLALGNTSHIPLVDAGGAVSVEDGMIKWGVNDPRCSELHGKTSEMGPAQMVAGYFGEPVVTNVGLASFITAFENLIVQFPGTVINATEGGAAINNAMPMYLREAISKHCTETVDKSGIESLLTLRPDADEAIRAALPLLEKDMKVLEDIYAGAGHALETCDKLEMFMDKEAPYLTPERRAALLKKNDRLTRQVYAGAEKLPLMHTTLYGASRKVQGREMYNEGDPFKNDKALARGIKRNRLIMTAARDAAESLIDTYSKSAGVLQAYLDGDHGVLDPEGETEPPSIEDAEQFLEAGNWARPLLEAEKIENEPRADAIFRRCIGDRMLAIGRAERAQADDRISGRDKLPLYFYLLNKAQELGRDKHDFEGALGLLREAHELLPERTEAHWGLATALHHVGKLNESIKEYESLVESHPDVHSYRYELGQVRLKNMDVGGLKDIQAAMEASTEFDHFIGVIARLYAECGLVSEALQAYELHLQNNPDDIKARKAWERLSVSS